MSNDRTYLPQIAESASFPCEVCNLVFDDAQSAANHSAAVHIADPRKRLVVCDLCLRVFANSFQVRAIDLVSFFSTMLHFFCQ